MVCRLRQTVLSSKYLEYYYCYTARLHGSILFRLRSEYIGGQFEDTIRVIPSLVNDLDLPTYERMSLPTSIRACLRLPSRPACLRDLPVFEISIWLNMTQNTILEA